MRRRLPRPSYLVRLGAVRCVSILAEALKCRDRKRATACISLFEQPRAVHPSESIRAKASEVESCDTLFKNSLPQLSRSSNKVLHNDELPVGSTLARHTMPTDSDLLPLEQKVVDAALEWLSSQGWEGAAHEENRQYRYAQRCCDIHS